MKVPSLLSAPMIGQGKHDPTPRLREEAREDCLSTSARLAAHEHMKKDPFLLTNYPNTIQYLQAKGDKENEIRRAQVDIQVKDAYSVSRKLYLYYKWYSSKSPGVLSRPDPGRPQSAWPPPAIPIKGETRPWSKQRTFRTNIIFPNPPL